MCRVDQVVENAVKTNLQQCECLSGNTARYSDTSLKLLRGVSSFGEQLACSQEHFASQSAGICPFDACQLHCTFDPLFQKNDMNAGPQLEKSDVIRVQASSTWYGLPI